jgi:hypothetical protein
LLEEITPLSRVDSIKYVMFFRVTAARPARNPTITLIICVKVLLEI